MPLLRVLRVLAFDADPSLLVVPSGFYRAILSESMSARQICKSTDHLFVPILEVSVPLLRCIHCDVFAYHDTVKQLAKNRSYRVDAEEPRPPLPLPYWRRIWVELRRRFASAGP